MSERWEGDNETVLGYCLWCKDPVREGEGHVCINGDYYHFDPNEPLKNCYFPDKLDVENVDVKDFKER